MKFTRKDLKKFIMNEKRLVEQSREIESLFGMKVADAVVDGVNSAIFAFAKDDEKLEESTNEFVWSSESGKVEELLLDDDNLWAIISGYVESFAKKIIDENAEKIRASSIEEPESTPEEAAAG